MSAQLIRKGRDPNFGAEKSLFKIQDQLLDMVGPLHVFGLTYSTKRLGSHQKTHSCWYRECWCWWAVSPIPPHWSAERLINPTLKSLASQEYNERESNLFGPGFCKKASKHLEVKNTVDKMSNQGKAGPQKRPWYDRDKSDPGRYLAKGTSVQCGGSKTGQLAQLSPPLPT